MIYTIGYKSWYDAWLIKHGSSFMKKGRDGEYAGGIAFIDIESAREKLKSFDNNSYCVYELETTIDNLYVLGSDYQIINSCRIIRFVE